MFQIVALSDIHYPNYKLDFKRIEDFLLRSLEQEKICFVLINGDLTQNGSKDEYLPLFDHLCNIRKSIKSKLSIEVEFILTPGNHDVNFKTDNYIIEDRSEAIQSIQKNPKLLLNPLIQNRLTSLQNDFFWLEKQLVKKNKIIYETRLCKIFEYNLKDSIKVNFVCFNSAFDSEKKEYTQYGKKVAPFANLMDLENHLNGDFVFTSMHHSLNWYRYNDRTSSIKQIMHMSNVVFYGHEHTEDSLLSPKSNCYLEKLPSLSSDDAGNGFKVYSYNNKSLIPISYVIDKDCKLNEKFDDLKLDYNESDYNEFFALKDNFYSQLQNIGNNFLNPFGKLNISNMYVSPYFEANEEDKDPETIKYEKLLDKIKSNLTVKKLILGDTLSGKTSLLKKLYLDLYEISELPVLLDCEEIKLKKHLNIQDHIENAFRSQYKCQIFNYEEYRNKIVVLVDNLYTMDEEQSNSQPRGLYKDFYEELTAVCRIVIVDSSIKSILTQLNNLSVNFNEYMIETNTETFLENVVINWCNIGNREVNGDIYKEVDILKSHLKKTAQRGGLELTPYNILLILTYFDNNKNMSDAKQDNIYSFYHEAMIRNSLLNVIKKDADIYAVLERLSLIACDIFMAEQQYSEIEFHQKHKEYVDIYKPDKSLKILYSSYELISNMSKESVSILHCKNGSVYFKHPHQYYYFVARYLNRNKGNKLRDDIILTITENLNRSDYSRIFLFLAGEALDKELVDILFTKSEEVLLNIVRSDYNGDSLLITNLNKSYHNKESEYQKLRKKINASKVEERRTEFNDQLYQMKKESKSMNELPDNKDEERSFSIGDLDYTLTELNYDLMQALNLMEIFSVLLKNFWGSLTGEQISKFISVIIILGAKSSSLILEFIAVSNEEFEEKIRIGIQQMIEDATTVDQVEKINDINIIELIGDFKFNLSKNLGISIIKKVSSLLDIHRVNNILDEYYTENKEKNYFIKLLSINKNLVSGRHLGVNQNVRRDIKSFNTEVKNKNHFVNDILIRIVIDYIYFNDVPSSIQDKLFDAIGVDNKLTRESISIQKSKAVK